jgi:urease accessory protein
MRTSSLFHKTTLGTVLAAALVPSAALAHAGHNVGSHLMAGVLHPLTGVDHVLMIVAVAAWTSLLSPAGRAVIAACLGLFVGAGTLLPAMGGPALEVAIALTVIGSGMLLATRPRWPLYLNGLLSAAFALIHGVAHGAEGPPDSGLYVAGLITATAALALAVSSMAAHLQSRSPWLRAAGMACAIGGAIVLAGQ